MTTSFDASQHKDSVTAVPPFRWYHSLLGFYKPQISQWAILQHSGPTIHFWGDGRAQTQPYCWYNCLFTLFPQWGICVVMPIKYGIRNNGNPASFQFSLMSQQLNEKHSRELAFTGGKSRRLRLEHHHHHHRQQQQHQMRRISGPGWIRRIFPPWFTAVLSPLMNPRVCPPTLQLSERWETARTIHHHNSTSSPLSFDFNLGNCGCSRT